MKVLRGVIVAVLPLFLLGCGALFSEKRIDYSAAATQVPALEIPPGLSQPTTVDTYKVPPSAAVKPNVLEAQKNADDIAMQIEETGVSSILIKDPFDKSWRRVGLAIASLKLALEDKDRSKGVYFLQKIKAGGSVVLPKESGDAAISYRVLVQDDGVSCSVRVIAADGISDAASKLILEAIYKNIQP
jgi:outer membrane protein assembly factor BamC